MVSPSSRKYRLLRSIRVSVDKISLSLVGQQLGLLKPAVFASTNHARASWMAQLASFLVSRRELFPSLLLTFRAPASSFLETGHGLKV